jgi:pimeloyl-ACP methyl ester carboxylesterase
MVTLPSLDGVEHKFVEVGAGLTIHVADAGPADGPPVMLVHGFPENWWEWHELIGPLAADGYRVLCPDAHISDFEVELVDGVGHWIVEQRPDLVLDRLRAFLKS